MPTLSPHRRWKRSLAVFLLVLALTLPAAAVTREKTVERIQDAAEVMKEILNIPEGSIPDSLLKECEAVLVIPGVVKGAFIVGARHGKGVMISRLPDGQWSNPCFVSISGGSVGFQIGGQRADLILVVRNRKGVDSILRSSFSLSGDANVTAGPVGRNAEAGTDLRLKASILSYSRSKGLFAGISLSGAVLDIDEEANYAFYNRLVDKRELLGGNRNPPTECRPLLDLLKPFAGRQQ